MTQEQTKEALLLLARELEYLKRELEEIRKDKHYDDPLDEQVEEILKDK